MSTSPGIIHSGYVMTPHGNWIAATASDLAAHWRHGPVSPPSGKIPPIVSASHALQRSLRLARVTTVPCDGRQLPHTLSLFGAVRPGLSSMSYAPARARGMTDMVVSWMTSYCDDPLPGLDRPVDRLQDLADAMGSEDPDERLSAAAKLKRMVADDVDEATQRAALRQGPRKTVPWAGLREWVRETSSALLQARHAVLASVADPNPHAHTGLLHRAVSRLKDVCATGPRLLEGPSKATAVLGSFNDIRWPYSAAGPGIRWQVELTPDWYSVPERVRIEDALHQHAHRPLDLAAHATMFDIPALYHSLHALARDGFVQHVDGILLEMAAIGKMASALDAYESAATPEASLAFRWS